jgi:hypothetical protein
MSSELIILILLNSDQIATERIYGANFNFHSKTAMYGTDEYKKSMSCVEYANLSA